MARDRDAARERARLRKLKREGHADVAVKKKKSTESIVDFARGLHEKLPKFLDTLDAEWGEDAELWTNWREQELDSFMRRYLKGIAAGIKRVAG